MQPGVMMKLSSMIDSFTMQFLELVLYEVSFYSVRT